MKKIEYFLVLLFVAFYSTVTFAGGDYWEAIVNDEISNSNKDRISISIIDEPRGIIHECRKITIAIIEDENKSIFKLFSNSDANMRHETEASINYINKKHLNHEKIYFGYISEGLHKDPISKCQFKSRGLKLLKTGVNDDVAVFSFYSND